MDWSRHRVISYLSDEKTLGVLGNKTFKPPGYVNDQLQEVELGKSEIEHKQPLIVGFFIFQYA